MPVNLSIKGVPDELAERLRERAASNHRSLQGELMAIVSDAVLDHPGAAGLPARTQNRGIAHGTRVGWRTTEDIAAELKRRFPKPVESGPLGVDIIRADRDSR